MKFVCVRTFIMYALSHPSRGAWIEIRKPYKCRSVMTSHPSRGAWIEIRDIVLSWFSVSTSHPSRGAWIEIRVMRDTLRYGFGSHPSRGAWIEIIPPPPLIVGRVAVAPLTGCVD